MKTLYTILFFLDTLALVQFTYFFLKLYDAGKDQLLFMALLCAIIICIVFLVYIMMKFLKLPGSGRKH